MSRKKIVFLVAASITVLGFVLAPRFRTASPVQAEAVHEYNHVHDHGGFSHHHGDGVYHHHHGPADEHHHGEQHAFSGQYDGFHLGEGHLVAHYAPEQAKKDQLKWKHRADLGVISDEVKKGIAALHGGSVEDPETGLIYTCFPAAGLHVLDAELKDWKPVAGSDPIFKAPANSHGICIWQHGGKKGLAIASTNTATVYVTDLGGKIQSTLTMPTGVEFDDDFINSYYGGSLAKDFSPERAKSVYGANKVKKDGADVEVVKGPTFSPTCVAFLDDTFYVTTGYSTGDFVLCAVIDQSGVPRWGSLAWGRRDEGEHRHATAHGVIAREVSEDKSEIIVASRANSQVYANTPNGEHLRALALPNGALVCNSSEAKGWEFQFYPLLNPLAAEKEKFASVLIYSGKDRVGRINPGEHLHPLKEDEKIDAEAHRFVHIHHALVVKRKGSNGKETLFVVIQSWNKGGTAVFELIDVEAAVRTS